MLKKDVSYKELIMKNPLIALGIGLCPLLAATDTFEKSYILGFSFFITIILGTLIISLINRKTGHNYFYLNVLIFAVLITIQEFFLFTYVHDIYMELRRFLPLIMVNFIVIEGFAVSVTENNNHKVKESIRIGALIFGIIAFIGLLREIIGSNSITILDRASSLTGHVIKFNIIDNNYLASPYFLTSSGAFLILGLILSLVSYYKSRGGKV